MTNGKSSNRIVGGISKVLENISMWPPFFAVLAMALMITVSIFSRYFGYPLQPVEEYTGYLAAIITMIGLTYILKRSHHIAIDLLPQSLRGKGRIALETITMLVSLGVVILFFITGTNLAIDSLVKHKTSWTVTATPLGWVQLIIPFGLGLFIIQILFELSNKFKTLFSRANINK